MMVNTGGLETSLEASFDGAISQSLMSGSLVTFLIAAGAILAFITLMVGLNFFISQFYIQKVVTQKLMAHMVGHKNLQIRVDHLESENNLTKSDHKRLMRNIELIYQQLDFQKGAAEQARINPKHYN